MRALLLVAGLWGITACSDRALLVDNDDEPIPRPEEGMWSACESQDDCEDLPYCVFPADEAGFCTRACEVASDCPSSYAPPDHPACTAIGGGDTSCALDCGGGRGCPTGMRCNAVETPDGVRQLCF